MRFNVALVFQANTETEVFHGVLGGYVFGGPNDTFSRGWCLEA